MYKKKLAKQEIQPNFEEIKTEEKEEKKEEELLVSESNKPVNIKVEASIVNNELEKYFKSNDIAFQKVCDVMAGAIELLHSLNVYNFSINYVDHKEGPYPFKKFKDNGECYNFGIVLKWVDMNTSKEYYIETVWG